MRSPIRKTKYAKAIRLGVMLGKKYANEYGQRPTYGIFAFHMEDHYNLFTDGKLFGMALDTAWTVFKKERRNLIQNVWTEEEAYAREEKANFYNMDSDEQKDYLLRKEVAALREEVAILDARVGGRN